MKAVDAADYVVEPHLGIVNVHLTSSDGAYRLGRILCSTLNSLQKEVLESTGSAADYAWRSVVYGDGLFVAVGGSGIGNSIMTSPDGTTWTSSRSSAADIYWRGVTYANGIIITVSQSGTGNRVMTSGTLAPARPLGVLYF